MASVSPNPAYYRTLGRADEIARMMNSPRTRAEHLFLAILHDDKHWCAEVLAALVDLNLVEAAVIKEAANSAGQPPQSPSGSEPSPYQVAAETRLELSNYQVAAETRLELSHRQVAAETRLEPSDFQVAAELGAGYVGREHLLLALIRDRRSVPARALASLVDLDRVENAVLDVMHSPGFRGFKNSFGEDELLLPAGQELDPALIGAIEQSLPAGAALGFNWRKDDGRPWIHVTQPGNPRDVLNAALASLGRPPLP